MKRFAGREVKRSASRAQGPEAETLRWFKLCCQVLVLGLVSCSSGGESLIGKRRVVGSPDLHVQFYQADDFDMATAVSFVLVDEQGSVVVSKRFMFGSHEPIQDTTQLVPFCYDSIFYVCYPYPKVRFMHGIGQNAPSTMSDLFTRIKAHDGKLVDGI
jgi:hypothetical protein